MTSYTPAMRQPCLLILLAKLVSIRPLVSLTERHFSANSEINRESGQRRR
jgi:hypothetical protein